MDYQYIKWLMGTVEDITTLTLTAGQQLVLSISGGSGLGFSFDTIYNTSLDSNVIQAALGSPTAQTPFNEPVCNNRIN